MQLRGRHYIIIVLVLLTSVLHFGAALDRRIFPDRPDMLFGLNGLGYLGLLTAYFVPIGLLQRTRRFTRWTLFLYTIVTIVAWLVIYLGFHVIKDGRPFFDVDALYGVPAKAVELALLFFLWQDKS